MNERLVVRVSDKITDWSGFWQLGMRVASSGRIPGETAVWVQTDPDSRDQHTIVSAPNNDEAVKVLDAIHEGLESGVRMTDLRSFQRSWDDKGMWEPVEEVAADTSLTESEALARGLQPLVSTVRQTPDDIPVDIAARHLPPAKRAGRTKHR
jgi:hypothetical protein